MTSGKILAKIRHFQAENAGYRLRLAKPEDAEAYFLHNYQPLDPLVVELTGSPSQFSRDEVVSFLNKSLASDDRCWFFIEDPKGNIVGETVISEIDWSLRAGHFRLCLFHAQDRGKGIGRWAVETTQKIAFEYLALHRLSLEVFSFNPHAEKLYQQTGFQYEGRLREAVLHRGQFADIILMAILEEQWRKQTSGQKIEKI